MSPRATYRLQLHAGFTFADAASLAPYLARLGISHAYLSPIQTARKGSLHGYDVVDHARINPELGGEQGFQEMAARLAAHGLGILLDIVPNHMAVGGHDNEWWLDVLAHGRASRFARFFDIDFDRCGGKILAPFLGEPYGSALRDGALGLRRANGRWVVAYHDHHFPLRPEDQAMGEREAQACSNPAELHALLERQHFRLAFWRVAGDEINWRRFFDITELAGLRIEEDDVFDAVHALPLSLYARGLVDGFRIDHVDGLADPAAYCRKLRLEMERRTGERTEARRSDPYIVVEKILAEEETLPPGWGVDGTTGYDFLAEVSALQHAPGSASAFTALWQRLSGRSGEFEAEEAAARHQIIEAFDAQRDAAAAAFHHIAEQDPDTRDISRASLRRAITLAVTGLRRYRGYGTGSAESNGDDALARALEPRGPDRRALAFLATTMEGSDGAEAGRRFNQLAAPVAAKAVEDTAFYRYGRLISRNDVGSDPRHWSLSVDAFHQRMSRRRALYPRALVATATHDHKRGEDARARLAALSESPVRWEAAIEAFFTANAPLRPAGIAADDEYIFYQSLLGAWPRDLHPSNREGLAALCARLQAWRLKSLREAKLRSAWSDPDDAYETAWRNYIDAMLDPARNASFLAAFGDLVTDLATGTLLNSLVQAVLRCTVPGVPDLYQGAERWDFSLVDPDNRRPVDYETRIAAQGTPVERTSIEDGTLKQQVIARLLELRRQAPALFAEGSYEPIHIDGSRSGHALAFRRAWQRQTLLVVVALHVHDALGDGIAPPPSWWEGTRLGADLPPLTDWLTGRPIPSPEIGAMMVAWPMTIGVSGVGR